MVKCYDITIKKIIFASVKKLTMAKNNKSTKKQVNVSDENLTSTENFFDQNKKTLISIGVGVLVVLLGYIAYQKFVVEPNDTESIEESWSAFYDFESDSTELAMNGSGDYSGMIDIADDYNGTKGGDIANYSMGIISMEEGDFETALTYFDNCSFSDVMVGNLCLGLQGDCYVELGQFEDAASFFLKAANREMNDYTTPMFLKKAALVYEELGENTKANKLYTRIKDEYKLTEFGTDIEKYIGRTK